MPTVVAVIYCWILLASNVIMSIRASPLGKRMLMLYVPALPGTRPSCAKDTLTFCEDVDKYPTELIKSLIQKKKVHLSDLMTDERDGLDEPPEHLLYPPSPTNARKTRSLGITDAATTEPLTATLEKEALCANHRTTIASPKAAMNMLGQWRYVVDGQFFKVNVCSEQHGNDGCKKMDCSQDLVAKPLLSLNPNGSLTNDTFMLPKSCRC